VRLSGERHQFPALVLRHEIGGVAQEAWASTAVIGGNMRQK